MIQRFIQGKCLLGALILCAAGCASQPGNIGRMQSYPVKTIEAEWIRNGQPIDFEDELWFPVDDFETLMDSEVYQIGQFQGIEIFVEKIDVRPYDRIYTKFDVNKFRIFERNDD